VTPAAEFPSARFETINRNQSVLHAIDVERLVDENHPARNIWDFIGALNLDRFLAEIAAVEGRAGRSRWDPRLLLSMWVYAYSRGISSAREIERQCEYEPGLQWLTGMGVVNHHTLSDFRVQHGEQLRELFVQVLGVLQLKKLITLERVTQDGTKIRANVNKKTFTRESKIRAHLDLARKHVEEMEREEAEHEKTRRAAARRRSARERVERLEGALAEVQRLQESKKWEKDKPSHASITDADAQFMRTGDHGLAPSYNVQVTTDAANGIIIGVEASKNPSDADNLIPALEQVKEDFGVYPKQVIADGDYTNRKTVGELAERHIDFYGSWGETKRNSGHGIHPGYEASSFRYDQRRNEFICPEGKRLPYLRTQQLEGVENHVFAADRDQCRECAARQQCSPNNKMPKHGRTVSVTLEHPVVEQFKEKMETEAGKGIYKQRSRIAEFPHAWLKTKLNFVRFRCRGVTRATTEALWACLTHNLQRYFALRRAIAA
jgi:transposase